MWVKWNLRWFWTWQDNSPNSKLFSAIWNKLQDESLGTDLLVMYMLACPVVLLSVGRMLRKTLILKSTLLFPFAFQDLFSFTLGYSRKKKKKKETLWGLYFNSQADWPLAFSSRGYLMTKELTVFKKKKHNKICQVFTGILGWGAESLRICRRNICFITLLGDNVL